MSEGQGKTLGDVYDRLITLEVKVDALKSSSFGDRIHDLEVKIAGMKGWVVGAGAIASVAVTILLKLI